MNKIDNKVILVTGGGQGLGAAICRTLAREKAIVVPVDIQKDKLEKITSEVRGDGGLIDGFVMDITNPQNIESVLQDIIDTHGRIDGLINNAGIDFTRSIEEFEYEQWHAVINVNLNGAFNMAKAVYPYMKKNGSGHIINIASTASKRAWPNASAYHASKWGLLGFSHALHSEARKDNIKVTALVAGGMQTPFLLDRFPDIDKNVLQDPQNVAETVLYVLCQPNGSVIPEVMVLPMLETSWP
jgi:NAD(P)-dependent dehydrogenase (short-subunit alcohol dehydrogenase family)